MWVARAGEAPRLAVSDFSGATAAVEFTPDGRALLLTGSVGTRTVAVRLDLEAGACETLLTYRTLASSFSST